MAIKLSDEVSKIYTSKVKQSDLTKVENKIKEEANSAANKKINEITQDQLKKVTSIIEKTPLNSSSDKVTQQDITNFVKVNFTGDIATSVNKLIDKSADEIVKEQIGNLGSQLDDTEISKKYNEAKLAYEYIYKSNGLLATMRAKYTKSMTSSIENIVDKQMNKFISNKWVGKILGNSQLGKQITNSINSMVTTAINQLLSDQVIKGVTDSVKNTVTEMKKKATNYLKENFSSQYEYGLKLKQAVKDKIKLYEEAKAKYIEQVTEYITKLKNEVNAYIKRITQTIADFLQSAIQGIKF